MKINRKAVWGGRLICILGILMVLFSGDAAHGSPYEYLIGIGFALVIVGVILLAFTQRCPNCGRYFEAAPFWWGKLGYCRKCGHRLEYDKPEHDHKP